MNTLLYTSEATAWKYFQRRDANDMETCLALNLQPTMQDQMNFKRFCNSVILIVSMETSGVLALG